MRQLKLGLESFSYHLALAAGTMDLPGFLQRCADLGLEGAALNAEGAGWGHLGGDDPPRVESLRGQAEDLGLYLELDVQGTAPKHLSAALALAAGLGAEVVRTYASVGGEPGPELERAREDLRQVLPLCAQLGIRLALENHEYETSSQIVALVEALDSEWLGTHVDTGNSMMVWEDPVEAVAALAPRAYSSHFKDHVVAQGEREPLVVGVELGTGALDCARLCRLLLERSKLERLNIEVCYGYSAPFRVPPELGGGARLGEGVFAVHEGPFDRSWIPPFALRPSSSYSWWLPLREALQGDDAARYLEWEDAAVRRSVEYVQGLADLPAPGSL
jgi:sugar phosphate isomerase/epimerase